MTDLTDRMRTCAAYILASDAHERDDGTGLILRDAAELLIEAAHLLDMALPAGRQETIAETRAKLGEPMEIIPPVFALRSDTPISGAAWVSGGDTLPVANPYRSANTCPQCDSRANKTVRREGNKLMLVCPVCAETWEFKR